MFHGVIHKTTLAQFFLRHGDLYIDEGHCHGLHYEVGQKCFSSNEKIMASSLPLASVWIGSWIKLIVN